MGEAQHKTGGIQIVLLGLLLLIFYHPAPKPTGYADSAAPPAGVYRCWTGGFDHLEAGSLTLAPDGHYESYRPGGGGRYSFTTASSTLEFLDGDYHSWEYNGVYQPTHQVRATQLESALPNTVQASPTRPEPAVERIVLMPLGATDEIGSERPGQYQYCYHEDARTAELTAR